MIVINEWFGRTGNNMLQLIRAIYYARKKEYSIIEFPVHELFTSSMIVLDNNKTIQKQIIYDSFFYLKKFGLEDPEPHEMKNIFNNFIRPIFKPTYKANTYNKNKSDEIFIHIRSGDIFSSEPHSSYVQPPLCYYKNIIEKYQTVYLIAEDNSNPCVDELLKNSKVKRIQNTLEKELEILSNVENLIIGFGSFGFLLYLINPYLKNLYVPKYFIDEFPKGGWGNEIYLNVIDLPNYIKVGEWKNTYKQRIFMIEYKI
jgi:hypothetical protein